MGVGTYLTIDKTNQNSQIRKKCNGMLHKPYKRYLTLTKIWYIGGAEEGDRKVVVIVGGQMGWRMVNLMGLKQSLNGKYKRNLTIR